MEVAFLPEALRDAEDATDYYENCVSGLGVRFRTELKNVCRAIGRQPLLFRERAGGYRRANFPVFPYYVVYFLRHDRVIVAAVGHAKRHPDFWKQRDV